MKTVKTFVNLAEAGFASSLLEAAGIPTLLAYEESFLWSYGMGTGGIRLQVEDADVEDALRVLEQGVDAAAVRPETDGAGGAEAEAPASETGNFPVAVFGAAAIVLGLLALAIWNTKEHRRAASIEEREQTYDFDDNGDGRADHFFTYLGQRIVRAAADRNFDGTPDEWEAFDRDGKIERAETDDNFDGRPDGWISYGMGCRRQPEPIVISTVVQIGFRLTKTV